MTATTHPTIAAFIAAQLDADEAAARDGQARAEEWMDDGLGVIAVPTETYSRYVFSIDPARVLAQVAALRAVVEQAVDAEAAADSIRETFEGRDDTIARVERAGYNQAATAMRATLRALASIWKDADGWQEEWR